MRNTEMICKNCIYRVPGTNGHICEKTGKHLYWNKQTCPDHIETATSYWKDQKKEKKK
jgi:uncharacterized radical SAM superfamily Fe-S cluster-containing enzyme